MSKLAYQKLIDEAVFQLKCCLNLCTQLFKIETSEESLEIGDYVLVRTPNGCILKPYNTIGIENLTWHDNFNDLNIDRPQPVAADAIAAVRGSQGIKWLPGTLGGTWYPKGYYRSTGAAWEFFGEFSYQASQPDTDAGLVTDQFVSPFTLKNAAQWSTKNDSIQFKDEGVNLGAPGTVDTFNVTGPGGTLSRVGNTATLNLSGGGGSSGYTAIDIDFTDDPYNFAFTTNEYILLVDCTLGNVNVNLPTAVGNQVKLTIIKIDSTLNKVLVNALGLELINEDSTYEILFQNSAMELMSTNLNWRTT